MGERATQVHRVVLDGVEQHDRSIHLVDDGKEHPVVVEVGDSSARARTADGTA